MAARDSERAQRAAQAQRLVLDVDGGRGAVREACEFLLEARGALQALEAGFR
jgi:3-deoxy-D-manno-octulosonate 8-phosphate phosphatase KdsC-like HAD superfamily phosphatase